jgi:NAD(P)-dependent dehydrogenase (short-subunit alcohol dehydrogenase family)
MVTGASSGLGKELVEILYQHNGTVYLAARSESKTQSVMTEVQARHPDSRGRLVFLPLQLDDLTTIKATADAFLSRESRLDVLWNNAGVMVPPQGSKTVQGYELQLGTNNLGHFLLTRLLQPVLERTSLNPAVPRGSVRVVWVSSSAADAAPVPAIDFENMGYQKEEGVWSKYARSKAGSQLYAAELARRTAGTGIISMALNPGNFVTNLQQNMPKMQLAILVSFFFFFLLFMPAKMTLLFGFLICLSWGCAKILTKGATENACFRPEERRVHRALCGS